MATLRPLGGDRWETRIYVGRTADGRPVQRKRIITVKGGRRAAVAAATKLEDEIRNGGPAVNRDRVTVRDMAEQWWAQWSTMNRAPNTGIGYRLLLDRRILPELGDIRLRALTVERIESWYARGCPAADAAPVAPATVRRIHAVLRLILRACVRWGRIATSPADLAQLPQGAQFKATLPTVAEIAAILEEIRSPSLRRLALIAAWSGMRRGELVGLQTGDVDTGLWVLTVTRSVADVRGAPHVKSTKTGNVRRVPVESLLIRQAIVDQIDATRLRCVALGVPETPWLWPTVTADGPMRPTVVTDVWRRACAAAGGPHVRLHDLRHWFASTMLGAGVGVVEVSRLLGHSSPATTMSVYAHVDPSGVGARAAVRSLPEIGG